VREWFPVDDRVMGGLSSSRAEASADGLVFTGDLSLEQNGGFASIRTRPRDYDLAGTRALVLRVRGDGKVYKLGLRTDDAFDGVQYQARFHTRAEAWEDVRLPIADFEPRFRGRPVPAPPLDPARIRTFGLLIADRQAGAFRLVLASLTAERSPEAAPTDR
jgi:NADH dehydrogenase [ubiquinone] 1 alpha subcomplex assembly factor 1